MKYIVVVNNKYLITVEAESACGAEHRVLDHYANEINEYGVIKGALAFDKKTVKTDYFWDTVSRCETVSVEELDKIVADTIEVCEKKKEAQAELNLIAGKIRDVEEEIRRLQKLHEALAKDEQGQMQIIAEAQVDINRQMKNIGA